MESKGNILVILIILAIAAVIFAYMPDYELIRLQKEKLKLEIELLNNKQ